jgi:hypothetical protein
MLIPGIEDFFQPDCAESGLAEPKFHLEGLPEFLAEALEGEAAEGEVVEFMLGKYRGLSFSLKVGETCGEFPIEQQHRVIVDGINGRNDGQKLATRTEASADGLERQIDGGGVGHHNGIDGNGEVDLTREILELVHGTDQEFHAIRLRAESLAGANDHSRREIEGEGALKPFDQELEQGACSTPEVDHGFGAGICGGLEGGDQRVDDAWPERVEEKLLVIRRMAAPLAILITQGALYEREWLARSHGMLK